MSKCHEAVARRQKKVKLDVMPDSEIMDGEHVFPDISGLFEALVPM